VASKLKRMFRARPKRNVRSENVSKIIDALRDYNASSPEDEQEAWSVVADLVDRATPQFLRMKPSGEVEPV